MRRWRGVRRGWGMGGHLPWQQNLRKLADALAPYDPRRRGFPPNLPFIWDAATLANGPVFTLTTNLGGIHLLAGVSARPIFVRSFRRRKPRAGRRTCRTWRNWKDCWKRNRTSRRGKMRNRGSVHRSAGPTSACSTVRESRSVSAKMARLGNLWVDSGTGEGSVEVAAEFAAGGLEGSLLFF